MYAASSLSAAEIVRLSKQYSLFDWTSQSAAAPIPITRAEGVHFWDADGKKYLDFSSQLISVNIGHGDKRVIRAIQEQAERLTFVSPFHATEIRALLSRRLASIAPGDLDKAFFTLGGADANENAVKLARIVTGRQKVVTRYRSYHGSTAGSASLTGEPRRFAAEPGAPGVCRVLDPYRYRCGFCSKLDACSLQCLRHVEEVVQYEGPQNIAAILMETVTGSNGLIVPPDGYLQGIRALCDKHGILLILDEVMTGFGRTGKWFASQHWNVVPDMMTLAKGLTSSYLPLGAVMVRPFISDYFEKRALPAGLTYNSHPMSLAAAMANLDVYEQDGLIERSATLGKVLAASLAKLKERHVSVGDVRSLGLFAMIELVKDRTTREPLVPFNPSGPEMGVMNAITAKLREKGIYLMVRWNNLFIGPPLCISEADLQEGLLAIDEALGLADERVAP